MADISTIWETTRGDWQLAGPQLANGNDIITAVLISLFTNRVANPDDVINDMSGDPRGWWGDVAQYPIGSRLWLIERAKKTQATLALAKGYIEEAIQWLIDDGVASRIDVFVEWTRAHTLGAQVTVYAPLDSKPIVKIGTQNVFALPGVQVWGWNADGGTGQWESRLQLPQLPLDVTRLFSMASWVGNGAASQTIVGIDMSRGGLMIVRSPAGARPVTYYASADGLNVASAVVSGGEANTPTALASFTSTGAVLTDAIYNAAGVSYRAWFFKKSSRFIDVVPYTGTGIGVKSVTHSLSVVPGRIELLRIDGTATASIPTYDINAGPTKLGALDGAASFATNISAWNSTSPTSAGFQVGDAATTNLPANMLAILWANDASADSVMKVVTWVGNSSSSGPIVLPGWKPQFLHTKSVDQSAAQWIIEDTYNNPSFTNPTPKQFTNIQDADSLSWGNYPITLVPNGFQITAPSLDINQGTYSAVVIKAASA